MRILIALTLFSGLTFAADPNEGVINARQFGAICDGMLRTPDDGPALQQAIDTAFGPASNPNGRNYGLNKILRFPPGHCLISRPLKFSHLMGATIEGAGEFTTTIENRACGDVIDINGAAFTVWRDMYLQSCRGKPGTVLDLNYDGSPGGDSLQGNKFTNMQFDGGRFGVGIGAGGLMGSENAFNDDHFIASTDACLATFATNALQNTVKGGNFQACGIGIWIPVGSVSVVSGTGFQTSVKWDIFNERALEPMVVEGVRTESPNFVQGQSISVHACNQASPGKGVFVSATGGVSEITGSTTYNGDFEISGWAHVSIRDVWIQGRQDWLNTSNLWTGTEKGLPYPGSVEYEDVVLSSVANPHSPAPVVLPKRRVTKQGIFEYPAAPLTPTK